MSKALTDLNARVTGQLSRRDVAIFLALNFSCVFTYIYEPLFHNLSVGPKLGAANPLGRLSYWIACVAFLLAPRMMPNYTEFLRRIILLVGAFLGLLAAISEFYASISVSRLVTMEITAAVVVQITSLLILALEIKAARKN